MTLDFEEIEKERGVIFEERRLRLGALTRIRDIQFPILFKDSQYAVRNIIGHPETIQSSNLRAISGVFANYYRPNLMAVVAVGDFELKIEGLFESILNISRTRQRSADPGFSST